MPDRWFAVRVGFWWLALALALAQALPAWAQPAPSARLQLSDAERALLAAREPLRVATKTEWTPIDAYTYEGQYRGLSGEYLHLIGKRLGMRIETIAMPTLAEGLAALREGRSDLVPSVARTAQREGYMLFSHQYLDVPNVYLARRGVGAVGEGESLAGLRVAVERGYAVIDLVRERHPLATIVEFDDTPRALRGVSDGAADVYLGALPTTTFLVERLLLTNLEIRGPWYTEFSRLHFGLRKEDEALRALIDKALDSITLAERQAIHSRWVPLRSLLTEPSAPMAMSDEERRFAATMPPLRVGYDLAHDPYTFRDATGRPAGMAFDILDALAQRVGLPVGPAIGGPWAEVYAKARTGQVDLLIAVARNAERERDFLFIGPWIGTPTVLVTRAATHDLTTLEDLARRRVAVLRDGQHQYEMTRLLPTAELVPLDTREALLGALAAGRVDAALSNVSFVVPRLQSGQDAGLKIAGMLPELNTDLHLAVRREQPQLAALLQRALSSMSETERASIAARWAVLDASARLSTVEVLRRAAPWLAALALALVVSLGWALRLKRQVQRTRAAEQALAVERDRANALARARGDFVVQASHEIRTPVNAVIGALDLLAREVLAEPAQKALALARRASVQLQEFVNNLLDLSKSDAGRLTIHPEEEDLGEALAEVVETLRHLAEHKEVALALTVAPALAARLVVDPMRLRQVVINLVSNAIKFTPAGGRVSVQASVLGGDDTSQRIAIEVEDSGIGIAPENLARLFQPYEQVHADGVSRAHGTGLGLVLVKRLVEAMGGSVELASRPGAGTTARVTLTLARGAQPSTQAAPVGRRVLVADDDPVQQIVLDAELRRLGCEVDIAGNGREALDLWRRHRHTLVFTDCRMPAMDGLEFTRALRDEPGGSAVCVIGTSADVDDAAAALAATMQRLVPKPVPRVLLQDLLLAPEPAR